MGDLANKEVEFRQSDFFSPVEEVIRPARSVMQSVERLKKLSKPEMVRVAPERYAWIPAAHCERTPEYCLARWVKCPSDGYHRLIPVSGDWVRMTANVAELLGWGGIGKKGRYDTLKRLGYAGFIEFVHAAPGVHFLELRSWFRHLADCQENPEMWESGSDDLETYRKANGLGGWRDKI